MKTVQLKIDVKYIKEILNLVGTLVREAKVDFTPDGLSIKVMDPARTCMIGIKVDKDAFQEYSTDSEIAVGLDVGSMRNFLKIIASGIVELSGDSKKIGVRVGSLSGGFKVTDPVTLATPKIPELNYSDSFIVEKSVLLQGIKAAGTIAEVVQLSNSPSGVKISAHREPDQETMELDIPKEQTKEFVYTSETKSLFALEYFLKFVQAMESATDLQVFIGQDYPVRIEGKFLNDKGKITFLLAPRIS